MRLTLTPLGDVGVAVLPPDIAWSGTVGDFALATASEDGPTGGLAGANPLRSAVLLLLFSDARANGHELRPEHGGDRRGWPGDGFDIDRGAGEAPLGSKLWTYRRRELTDGTARAVAAEARRSLEPLVAQGAAARIDVEAVAMKAEGRIDLSVAIYGRDGRAAYSERFDVLWRRADGRL